MTLAEAGEIFAYWEHSPPTHLIVQAIAGMLGWTPPPVSTAAVPLEAIAAAPPPGLVVARGGGLGMPLPVLDPDTLRAHKRARASEIAGRNRSDG
jgi:hypothetical protein